ncbi:MAG: cation:dicarboxylase symporter family transporter, partial [Woeseia sp.]
MKKLALHWQILIAIGLSVFAGGAVNYLRGQGIEDPSIFGVSVIGVFDYIGSMFLNALKMIIVPLIFSSITVGVAGIGSGGNLGALGGKTLLFYLVTTVAAILVGLLLINIVGPGYIDGEPVGDLLGLNANGAQIAQIAEGRGPGDVAEVFK